MVICRVDIRDKSTVFFSSLILLSMFYFVVSFSLRLALIFYHFQFVQFSVLISASSHPPYTNSSDCQSGLGVKFIPGFVIK